MGGGRILLGCETLWHHSHSHGLDVTFFGRRKQQQLKGLPGSQRTMGRQKHGAWQRETRLLPHAYIRH